jgi:secreted trypsin-like serine protease
MRRTAAILILLLHANSAQALVGGAREATNADGGTHAVLLVGSRGSSCTGAAIARDLVLTAAHCVQPGADYKLVEFDAARSPTLREVSRIDRHPQFSLQTMLAHRATADVALVKLAAPLPATVSPARLSGAPAATTTGGSYIVTGYGLTVRGDGRSGGTLRAAELIATGKPGSLQLRLVDPQTNGTSAGLSACTGDSGAPVFVRGDSGVALIGVVSWSTGPNASAGCGGLTGVTPIARYRAWIIDAARRLGATVELAP